MPRFPHGSNAQRARARVGRTLCSKYRVGPLLGVGGMAAVYAGEHRNGHAVAIKILHDQHALDDDIRRLFAREAYVANRVGHPGAVNVLDDDIDEQGCAFLIMPLLKGETVHSYWERCGPKLPVDEVLAIAHGALEVLAVAHAKGIVHRDIKPDNLFLTAAGEQKVLDFGIARAPGTSSAVTRTGRAMGTPAFMPPEQALGRRSATGPHSDCWSVGATMFTLLCGEHVHVAEGADEQLVYAASRPARSVATMVPGLAPVVADVVDRALAFDSDRRWPHASAMREALRVAFGVDFLQGTSEAIARIRGRVVPLVGSADLHEDVTRPPLAFAATALLQGASDARLERTVTPKRLGSTPSTSSLSPSSSRRSRVHPTRSRRTVVAGIALACALAGGGLAFRQVRRAESENTPKPVTTLTTEQRTWYTTWLDGDATRVRNEAERALESNASDVDAHFAYVVATHFWPDEATRMHFMRARELRDRLSADESAYLDALAPGMTVPPDFPVAAEKLSQLFAGSPSMITRMALIDMKLRLGDLDGSRELLAPVVDAPNPAGLALARFAHVAALKDDVDTARAGFRKCLDGHPGSQVCAEPLVVLEMNEGRCADAERILRKQLSVSPDPNAYLYLAYALERQGVPIEEIEPVLKNWVRASPAAQRERNSIRAEIRMQLVRGDLRAALAAYDRLGSLLESIDDDAEQFDYTGSRLALEAELGRTDAAAATLARYTTARNSYQRHVAGEDNLTYLFALGVQFGVVSWKSWLDRRDARLALRSEVDDQLDGKARSWLQHFAMPATSRSTASEALDVLPGYLPLLHRADRHFVQDGAISRVYALTGHDDLARPFSERATKSCDALDDLVQFRRAEVEAADAFARLGDNDRACRIYADVLNHWPVASGSVTSRHASEKTKHVCQRHGI